MNIWKERLGNWRNWVALLLFAIALYQAYLVFNGYALIWLKRAWKNLGSTSTERSSLYYFGDTGNDFLRFIEEHVPTDMNVIVPGKTTQFASQNVLQFYLYPRGIISCQCDKSEQACKVCLQDPASYIPATNKFPPVELLGDTKQFIPFESKSTSYLGIYVPTGVAAAVSSPAASDASSGVTGNLLLALLIDLCLLAALALLGFMLARTIIPGLAWLEALSLSVPFGAGLFTWCIFLTALIRIPIILPVIILVYMILAAGMFWLFRRSKKLAGASQPSAPLRSGFPGLSKLLTLETAAWVFIIGIFLMMAVISVNRSYSQFDDIAIWSLKGYGIANTGTIYDINALGGHGLAYPLNIPLFVTIFKLASGDILPGSKFLEPILSAAMAYGAYRFWRRWGVNPALAWSGMLLLVTVPEIFLHSTLGFANLPFAAYLVLGVFWSVDGLLRRQARFLFLGGLLFAFAAWTRPEGIVFAGILMAVIWFAGLIATRRLYFSLAWIVPLIVPVVWLVFAAQYVAQDQAGGALNRLVQDLFQGSLPLGPLKMTINFARSTAVTPTTWGYIFPVAAVMLVAACYRLLPRVNPPAFLLFFAALLAILAPAGLFFVESTTEGDFATVLSVSFNRAYIPAAFLVMALAVLAVGKIGRKKADIIT